MLKRDKSDSLPHAGLMVWDLNSDCVQGDAVVASLFGFDPEVAEYGQPILTYLHRILDTDRPRIAKAIHDAIVTGENLEQDYDVRLPDGRVTPVSSFARVFRSADGVSLRLVGVMSRRVVIKDDPLLAQCLEAFDLASQSGKIETARILGDALLSLAETVPASQPCALHIVRQTDGA